MPTNHGKFAVSATQNGTYTEFDAKSIQYTFESLATSDSGRTDDGVMHITWVKRKIRKFNITMPPIKYADITRSSKNPLLLVQGKEYYIKIFDPSTSNSTFEIYHVYTSNSSGETYNGVLYDGLWTGIAFNAIELGGDS